VSDQLISALLAAGIIILVAFPVHEFSHAWVANMLGDATARWQGRLTLDPRVHFDPLGGVILIVSTLLSGFFIGWAKPTPVNPYNLRHGRRGEALVALGGPASNLLLATVVAVPVRLIWADPSLQMATLTSLPVGLAYNIAFYFVMINALLFIFNLLPIPPLDGWKLLGGLVSARLAYQMRSVEQYGFLILLLVLFAGRDVVGPVIGAVVGLFVGDARPVGLAGL
jgi:Zn-dependent protease